MQRYTEMGPTGVCALHSRGQLCHVCYIGCSYSAQLLLVLALLDSALTLETHESS